MIGAVLIRGQKQMLLTNLSIAIAEAAADDIPIASMMWVRCHRLALRFICMDWNVDADTLAQRISAHVCLNRHVTVWESEYTLQQLVTNKDVKFEPSQAEVQATSADEAIANLLSREDCVMTDALHRIQMAIDQLPGDQLPPFVNDQFLRCALVCVSSVSRFSVFQTKSFAKLFRKSSS